MPLWDLVPAVRDGDYLTDDAGNAITTDDGGYVLFDAGWRLIPAEVDASAVN